MPRLLVLHNSLDTAASATRQMSAAFASAWRQRHPGGEILERDLVAQSIPHLGPAARLAQLGAATGEADEKAVGLADTLIDELEGADTIAIGVPLYNFTIPSTLKAWIDHVVRVRRTFAYVDGASRGLLPPGKQVVLLIASGGAYTEGPAKAFDFAEPYLRMVLGFIGLTDIAVVRAENQAAPGSDGARAARERALETSRALAA